MLRATVAFNNCRTSGPEVKSYFVATPSDAKRVSPRTRPVHDIPTTLFKNLRQQLWM